MKKVVISGSVALQPQIQKWRQYFLDQNYEILDHPKPIPADQFAGRYPETYRAFMESIKHTDVLFIMNEDRNGTAGYIGAAAFAELAFGLAQRMVEHRKIELLLLKMPGPDVPCYDEVSLWHRLGWIKILNEDQEIVL